MGCASSKIDDTDAVALCRSRVAAVDSALRCRYDFAEAHLAYLQSLKSVSVSFHRFFHSAAAGDALVNTSAAAPPSPILNLPAGRKIDDDDEDEHLEHHIKSPGSSSPHHLSHSSSGSHLHFDPDSEDEDEISGSEPLHHDPGMFREGLVMNSNFNFNPHNVQMNFMKKQPTPSVSYEQKPAGMESVQIEVTNPPYYPYYMPNQNSNSHFYGDPYGAGGSGTGGYGMGGYYGGQYSSQPEIGGFGAPSTSEKQPPPPPPPPASTSTWDFLNPFENIESNYPPPYTPSRASKGSRDSREVREEEGIPDLEDEDYHLGAVNEVYGGQKLADVGGGAGSSDGGRKSNSMAAEAKEIGPAEAGYRARPSDSQERDRVEYEVHMVDKEVVREEGRRSEEQGNVGAFNGRRGGFRNVSEVVREIQVQFERASDSGGELGRMLEAGKLPYRHKSSGYQVSSKMLYAIAPSLPSTSRDSDSAADIDEDMGLSSGSLSATLQKLYLWEKKLFEEVKFEEKNRVANERKMKKLQRLDEKGAEVQKINASHSAIKDLSTKIRISIQIIDKISVKISKLRDEELWPQLNELIQGFSRMWKGMLDCHHSQCQAVDGATGLDAIVSSKNSSDAHLEAILQLEHELINWTTRFSNWIDTQKGYVTALNEWLLNCIVHEPEKTADGEAPFSPGRAGAPPIFVICNQWVQSLDRLSEKEVIDSMKVFAAMVFQFWERDKVLMQQRMVSDKDVHVERRVKNLQREDMKIQKQIQALEKKTVHYPEEPNTLPLSGNVVYPGDTKTSLQSALQHIFEAMDRYTSESLKVYEELLSRSEEVVRERSGA